MGLAIQRFSLSLARKGGCGWGAERARIFTAMQHALPAAVGKAFAARLEAHSGLAIADPIRLDVRLSLAELAAACESPDAMALLAKQIVAAWAPPAVNAPSEADCTEATTEHPTIDTASPAEASDPVLATLLDWHRRGELVTMLAGFSVGALRRWLAAVARSLPRVAHVVVEALAREDVGAPKSHDTGDRDVLRAALAEVVQVVADPRPRTQPGASAPAIARAAASHVHVAPTVHEPDHATGPGAPIAVPSVGPPPARSRAATPSRLATTTTIDGLALPFLLLRPLSQIGWLDAVAASFAANELASAGFAAALALAVSRPPDRGWRHHPDDLATAAAFAGETMLPAFAFGDTGALVAPLDRVIARAVLAGHDPRRPLLLHRCSDGLLLVEPDGLFPIAWRETLDDLLVVTCPITSVLAVPATTADAATLAAVDAHGLRFLTDAAPSRHERWRRLVGARAWTNDHVASDEVLVPHASVLPLAEDVDELVACLANRQPRDLPPPIARSSGLAAAVALGDIAHRLWRDREPTSPQLALARLGDLSARIVVAHDRIDVRIPLGARHRDLDRAGFLSAPTVHWLDRRLTIGGG